MELTSNENKKKELDCSFLAVDNTKKSYQGLSKVYHCQQRNCQLKKL